MSEVVFQGKTDYFKTTGGTITVGRTGVESVTDNYLLPCETYTLDDASSWAISELSESHETYNHLKCVNGNVTNNGPFIQVSLTYSGFDPEGTGTELTISAALSQEPIDTHPDFEEFAGNPDKPKNGAEFNDDKTFKGFRVDVECPKEEENNKAGVKSYLVPSIVCEATEQLASKSNLNLGEIGKIKSKVPKHNPPGSNKSSSPPTFSKRDWLIVGEAVEGVGKQMIKKTKYRLSGEGKWNEDIYPD